MAKNAINVGDYVRHKKTGNIGRVLAKYKTAMPLISIMKPTEVLDVAKPDDKGVWEATPLKDWEYAQSETS